MNIYIIHANGNYCGGTAIVAAENEKEAIALIDEETKNSYFSVCYFRPVSVNKIENCTYTGPSVVIFHHEFGE